MKGMKSMKVVRSQQVSPLDNFLFEFLSVLGQKLYIVVWVIKAHQLYVVVSKIPAILVLHKVVCVSQ